MTTDLHPISFPTQLFGFFLFFFPTSKRPYTLTHFALVLVSFRRLARFALYILTCVAVALSFFESHKSNGEPAGESNSSVLKRQRFSVP